MASDADKYLPGHPAPKRIREVRRHLKHYGITPTLKLWRLTWEWANKVRMSYYDPRWPLPSEIGTQYVVLMLADMRDSFALRLPYRAQEQTTPAVLAALGQTPPALPERKPEPRVLPATSASLFDTTGEV